METSNMQVIDTVEGCEADASKRGLNLSHRFLRELDAQTIGAFGPRTQHLDLSHNRLTSLQWIYEFPHLRCLVLDDNRLREVHLERLQQPLPEITTLTLNKNELSDLNSTAKVLQRVFPNLQYLSLHGNPMCPDDLCLQPFSEFVPYEYSHYRSVLSSALPHLKFLDHFSLDTFNSQNHLALPEDSKGQTAKMHQHHPQQRSHAAGQLSTSSGDLWSKLKCFLTANHAGSAKPPSEPISSSCLRQCAPACKGATYRGIHSEGNRFITNSDL